MQRFMLMLDLKNESKLIQTYENYHQNIPADIAESIRASGIESMEIYRFENRLVMEIVAYDNFSFEEKSNMDASNEKVQAWEQLMSQFQQVIPGTPEGDKWVLTKQIFKL
ncbi:L-rhamnose mutarotase [Aquirufa aurantiipilula]|uniref:L-rhamnose mutarotase n=1 Tax=Aquirufa aurantiipilula TaxID=2696561 RepID=A0ABT6BHD8_9BACT|nr:L-rhamnose mutarotase [Aquirufa aurantiipilula]MDF5689710.1 L-rhamnose mutarotase [Aquirufa aurantiipilula]